MSDSLDRRKVTMVSISMASNGDTLRHEATDYVSVDHLDAYVADAQTRWQSVTVGDKPDSGPAGDKGKYDVAAATTAPEEN